MNINNVKKQKRTEDWLQFCQNKAQFLDTKDNYFWWNLDKICEICNFMYFKFAIQNSHIAIQNMILLRKFFSCIALLLCKNFKRNRSLGGGGGGHFTNIGGGVGTLPLASPPGSPPMTTLDHCISDCYGLYKGQNAFLHNKHFIVQLELVEVNNMRAWKPTVLPGRF